ncbi:MAG: thioredoxin family protein [Ignavibacteriaceae bacterium]
MSTKTLKIGSKIPSFKLKGVDDQVYSLDTFSDKDLLVVIFSCNHCPYVQAYEDRIKEIQSEFGEKGLAVIAINSNDDSQYPDDSFENMKKRAKGKNFNFPYLRDEAQTLAKAFDASHTPEIFLFNKDRDLVYHGKIDDNWKNIGAVKSKYLRDAITESIHGEEISVPETFSIGCTIKWKG